MHESGSGPEVGHEERRNELKWWGASGFAGGFIVTAMLSATILGVGLNINLGSESQADGSDVIGLVFGERIYDTNCASCHGSTGGGGVGPALGNGAVVENFSFLSRQIAVISEGQGAMPAFAITLTAEEIEAVAIFEREKLGQ